MANVLKPQFMNEQNHIHDAVGLIKTAILQSQATFANPADTSAEFLKDVDCEITTLHPLLQNASEKEGKV
ncbi:MAG: hypothetical protein K6G31_00155 [Paludibacteraceae bacterium]|nr:hypothetical protein [Paludibacteraceae bacterium]